MTTGLNPLTKQVLAYQLKARTMKDHDKDPIIESESDSSDGASEDHDKRRVIPKRTIIVEPVFMLYTLSLMGASPVMTQYLYARFEKGFPILLNQSHTGNVSDTSTLCVDKNQSDPTFIAIQSVQSESAQWSMYIQLCSSIIAIFTTLIYGGFSDARGRKPVLVMPCLAATIKLIINSCVIYFELPLYCLLVGAILEGLSGGFATLLTAVFAYTADTTTKKQRGFRIAVVESCMIISMAAAQLGMGYFIKATGFLYPYATCAGFMVINLVYIIFFVPETIVPDKTKKYSLTQSFKNIYKLYSLTENRRHVKLILVCLMFFTFMLSYGGKTMQTLFVMNVPLCWGPVLIGIYSATGGLVLQVAGLIGLKLLKWFSVSEIGIAAIGVVSGIGGLVLNAFATTDLMMYMVCLISFMMMLPAPMFRSIVSCLVKPDEQGRAFAGIACVEATCMMVISFLFSLVYQKTLYFMPGFIFLMSAGFGVITLILIMIYRIVEGRSTTKRFNEVLTPEEAVVN